MYERDEQFVEPIVIEPSLEDDSVDMLWQLSYADLITVSGAPDLINVPE